MCEWWFQRFKCSNFEIADKEKENRQKWKDVELQAFLNVDNSQTQKQIAEQLGVS